MRTHVNFSSNTFHSSYHPFLQFVLYTDSLAIWGMLWPSRYHIAIIWPRKEIENSCNSIIMNVACLENIRRGKILLFRGICSSGRRGNAPITAFVLIEESAEYRRRVEIGPVRYQYESLQPRGPVDLPAHEVKTAVNSYQGGSSHVAN